MGLAWNSAAIPGLLGGSIALLAAAFVFAIGSARPAGRRLAFVLLAEGIGIVSGVGLEYLAVDVDTARGFAAVAWSSRIVVPAAYLSFLATVGVPWMRFVDWPWARVAIGVAVLAGEIAFLSNPESYMRDPGPTWYAPWTFQPGPARAGLAVLVAAGYVLGLAVALSAYLQATSPIARRRARAYVIAFGVRDVLFFGFLVGLFVSHGGGFLEAWGAAFGMMVYVPLLAYGILRTQLFDLDARIKWTLKRGTVGAAFLAVFLVVTQMAQNGLSTHFGWIWGGAAAGLLLFVLSPLVRFSERLANAAMPSVSGTDEYFAHRRIEVYKGALEEMWADGAITAKDRAVLKHLQEKLDLDSDTVSAIERDVQGLAERRLEATPR